METRSKKRKMNEVEDVFVKYKVPDEILEKIISYVPSKNNCFLVSKRFHRESIRATRGKCVVNLTRENVESSGFENIPREFDEIRIINKPWSENRVSYDVIKTFVLQSLKFIEKFGWRIKKLVVCDLRIDASDFLKLLIPMPNLVELHFKDCEIYRFKQFLQSLPSPVGVLQMTKLEKLLNYGYSSRNDIIGRISCPSLLTYKNERSSSKIFEIHSGTLKDVELNCADDDEYRGIFEQLRHCKLERFSHGADFGTLPPSPAGYIAQLIQNQTQLKSLQLYRDVTEEQLQSIVNLEHLESLDISIPAEMPFPQLLVAKIMQMPKLKSLKIALRSKQSIESLLSFKNEQLQSLELDCESIKDVVGMSRIGDNFPNLEHLGLRRVNGEVCLKFVSRLKKLESLNLRYVSCKDMDDLEVNESVRCFSYFSNSESPTVSAALKLIQTMPNIQTFELSFFRPESTKLLDKVLSLQSLIEIKCYKYYLLEDGVITCIKNRPQSSTLQRIICKVINNREDVANRVAGIYEDQFPFRRVNYVTDEIVLSRF